MTRFDVSVRADQNNRHSSRMSPRRALGLVPALLVSGLLALPTVADASTTTVPAPRTSALTSAQFENELFALTNARRKAIGCPTLKIHTALVASARAHSGRMYKTGVISHRVPGEAEFGARVTAAGYKYWKGLGENIAYGLNKSPSGIFSSWMNSSVHRANIQNCKFREVGYGVKTVGNEVWVTGVYGWR